MPGVNDALAVEATPLPELLTTAQNLSQSWERLLFASGGALELSKCFAYVMYWDLSGSTHRLVRPDEIPGCSADGTAFTGLISLTYGDKSATWHHLATISTWEGRRTLGVRIAPAGNWDDEYKYRRYQARDLALRMSGAILSKEAARLGIAQC